MKKYLLAFLILLAFESCKKVEVINLTGTLKVKCSILDKDFQNIQIAIYPYEDKGYSLYLGHPDDNGIYKQELLQGNYNIQISYKSSGSISAIQIIAGKESELNIDL